MNLPTSGCSLLLAYVLAQSVAQGSVVAIGIGDFAGGSSLITFNALADGTEVNGFSTGGVQFAYSLGNGHVILNGGPGVTNHVSPPNVVSVGANTGILSLSLPGLSTQFGYGFAVLATVPLAFGTSITLFNGATNVGSLAYSATPDPTFAGGFAGIESTIAFDSVQVQFNSAQASAFAMDNIRFNSIGSGVPEPATLAMMGFGLSALLMASAKRRKQ